MNKSMNCFFEIDVQSFFIIFEKSNMISIKPNVFFVSFLIFLLQIDLF